jgi:hypothetical protein
MLKKTWVTAVVLGASLGLAVPALTASGAVARSSVPRESGWQVSARVTGLGDQAYVWAVTAGGTDSEWAFGTDGNQDGAFALERTGSTWSRVPFPGDGEVMVARASSASDVWAFTDFNVVHWNGRAWSVAGRLPVAVADAVVFGPADVWAFSNDGGIWRYNGRSWSQMPGSSGLASGSALSPTSVWAGGGSVIAHWNGSSWTRTSVAKLLPTWMPVSAVYAAAADSVYAIADSTEGSGPDYILHWNGQSWSKVGTLTDASDLPRGLTGDGSGGFWLVVYGVGVMHYSDGRLTAAKLPIPAIDIKGVSRIPGTADILAAGVVAEKNATSSAAILDYAP